MEIWQVIETCDPGLAFDPGKKKLLLLKTLVRKKEGEILVGKL